MSNCNKKCFNNPVDRQYFKATENVSAVWKAFLDEESEDLDSIVVDNILSGSLVETVRDPPMQDV